MINPLPQLPNYEVKGIDALKIQNTILARQDAERKAQMEQQQSMRLNQLVNDYMSKTKHTNEETLGLGIALGPKMWEALAPTMKNMSDQDQKAATSRWLRVGASALSAVNKNDIPAAQTELRKEATASRNSGDNQTADYLDRMADNLGTDPEKGRFDITMGIAALGGEGVDLLKNLNTLEGIRKSQEKDEIGKNAQSDLGKLYEDFRSGRMSEKDYRDAIKKHNTIQPGIGLMLGGGIQGPGAAENYAERLIKGLEPWPGVMSLRTDPVVREGIQIARMKDPEFNASTHAQRQKTYQAFTTGKQSDVVNALNTGMGHLSQLSDLADQLGNGSIKGVNAAKNWAKKQSGDPTITAFDTTKKAVSDEVTRVWRGTGGSEKDVQTAMSNLDSSLSPAQLRSNIYQLTKLMASKQSALEDQYRKGMGKFGELEVLDPEAKSGLEKIQSKMGLKPKSAPSGNIQVETKVNPANGKTYYKHSDGKFYLEPPK